jgi:hypothetical protein
MRKRSTIIRVLSVYLVGAILSVGLLIWILPNHRPSVLDFTILFLLELLFTTCFLTVNAIEGGVVAFVVCTCLGVVDQFFEAHNMTFPITSLIIAILVSLATSRVPYRFNKRRATPEERKISITDQGFDIIGLTTNFKYCTVTWVKVYRINAYKADLFSIDLICLTFQQEDSDQLVEIHEDMDGFKQLAGILPQRFCGFEDIWYSKVLKPAFATNFTEVWKRA